MADARAALSTDETNLSKASIRSPIDGVVLTRSVEPGNAVAASLQAVTLFTIAEDLTKLRLQVNVDEADVGSVVVGQKRDFTVSAYPSRRYPATITRVAFGSTTTDNVVTYVTYLDVDNADLSLRPGHDGDGDDHRARAARRAARAEHRAALHAEHGAQRRGGRAARERQRQRAGVEARAAPARAAWVAGRAAAAMRRAPARARQLWVLRDGLAVPLTVTTGVSDGRVTEISGGELQARHAGHHRPVGRSRVMDAVLAALDARQRRAASRPRRA